MGDNAGAILCIDDKLRVLPKLVEPRQINNNYQNNDDDQDDDDDEEEEEDDDDDETDNLQWRKLKQFPPSPMRNNNNHNHNHNDNDNNNKTDVININQEEQMSDNQFFNTIQPQ